MAGEYEHNVEFDDLNSEAEEAEIEVDLEDGETTPAPKDDDSEPPPAEATPGDDDGGALDLDALFGAPEVDDRYEKLESQVQDQQLRDKQQEHVTAAQTKADKLEQEIGGLCQQLREAKEKGNTDREMELDGQLADKRADLRDAVRYRDWYKSDGYRQHLAQSLQAERPKDDADEQAARSRREARAAIEGNPTLKKWLGKNRWFLKPANAEQQAASKYAQALDVELRGEGLSPTADDYFAALNKRLSKRFPELLKVNTKDAGSVPRGGGEQGGHRRSSKPGRVRLGPEDFANMRKFGLDPENKAHLREYAANKRG